MSKVSVTTVDIAGRTYDVTDSDTTLTISGDYLFHIADAVEACWVDALVGAAARTSALRPVSQARVVVRVVDELRIIEPGDHKIHVSVRGVTVDRRGELPRNQWTIDELAERLANRLGEVRSCTVQAILREAGIPTL